MTAPANPFASAPATTPAPVIIPETQNPAVVDPGAAAQAAAFAAWQAEQARAAAAAAQPVASPAPVVDPAYAAWQAAQAAAATSAPAAIPLAQTVTPAQVVPSAPAGGGDDPFDDPAPQRPRGPRPQELYGRLVLIIPKLLEKVASTDPEKPAGTMVERLTADVVVLDGGPIAFGGRPEAMPPVPHNQVGELPYRNQGMYVSAVGIISQCRDALEKRRQGKPGMVIGRVTVGTQNDPRKKPPYLLDKATDADRALARAYLATIDPFS